MKRQLKRRSTEGLTAALVVSPVITALAASGAGAIRADSIKLRGRRKLV